MDPFPEGEGAGEGVEEEGIQNEERHIDDLRPNRYDGEDPTQLSRMIIHRRER